MTRIALLCFLLCVASVAQAQKKTPAASSSLCTQDYAVDTTNQQILLTRTFDNPVHRITVLIRAADLLWPYDQEKALAAFMEAFDLAVQNFKENGDQTTRASQNRFSAVIALPDQRFRVLSALARRDPAKARKLSEQILRDPSQEVADKSGTPEQLQMRTTEKILTLADRRGVAQTN